MINEIKVVIGSRDNNLGIEPDFDTINDWWNDASTLHNLVVNNIKYTVYLLPGIYRDSVTLLGNPGSTDKDHFIEITGLPNYSFDGHFDDKYPIFKNSNSTCISTLGIEWIVYRGICFDGCQTALKNNISLIKSYSIIENCAVINSNFSNISATTFLEAAVVRNCVVMDNTVQAPTIYAISGNIIHNNMVLNNTFVGNLYGFGDSPQESMSALGLGCLKLSVNNIFCNNIATNKQIDSDSTVSDYNISDGDLYGTHSFYINIDEELSGIKPLPTSSIYENGINLIDLTPDIEEEFWSIISINNIDIQGKLRDSVWSIGPFDIKPLTENLVVRSGLDDGYKCNVCKPVDGFKFINKVKLQWLEVQGAMVSAPTICEHGKMRSHFSER